MLMRNTTDNQQPQNLKKKLMSALAMLLVATTLMTTTSYAWFVLSTAPEVTGITTNVGANGSLEIALLNADTYEDMSLIRAGAGTSMVSGNPAANNAWGNLVDLGYQEYGLSNLTLLPSRLMVSGSEGSYIVDTNLLAVPTYGFDGRVIELDTGTYSAIYQNGEFAFTSGKKDYGVRAVGTSDALSAQGSALASAKANIPAYIKNAQGAVRASLNSDLVGLIMKKSMGKDYVDADLLVLDATLTSLDNALTTIDNTLRQGLIAYAASQIQSEETFNTAKNQITNPENSLAELVSQMADVAPVPGTFNTWVTELGEMQNSLNGARIALDALEGGSYTWEQIRGVMDYLLNMNGVYIGNKLFSDYSMDELMQMVTGGNPIAMSLRPGAGIYADVADFVGNYSASVKALGTVDATMTTLSAVNPSYLNVLNTGDDGNSGVQILTPADGGDEITVMPLDATYGYAIDLAFRCNAADPDLVLQTSAVQRVYTDSESGSTQGGGSYMAFTSSDPSFTLDQMKALMDAVRVAFVNDQGGIMSVAKLNITNAAVETDGTLKGMLKAPMYLYEYTFEPDENGDLLISFGDRLKDDNVITDLDQNVAKAVTAVVWLDGDLVDNTMVSAEAANSLTGIMNLQFATNAQLVPAYDDDVKNWTANADVMAALAAMMDPASTESDVAAVYAAGQSTWTTASWNNFVVAYERAAALNAQANPGEVQVRDAVKNLAAARLALTEVSKDAVNEQIAQLRNEMGTSQQISGYIVNGELVTEFDGTEEWIATATPVYGVDHMNNNLDGEEGVKTPIYSDETWNNLADALYNAELVAGKADATDEEVDAALSALETAKKALTYQVAFLPYEYKETVYYKTSYDADVDDVYGDWYDSSFKRIYSEVMMLTLDAYAEPAKFISVNGATYMDNTVESLDLDVSFLDAVYPELRDVQVKGIRWSNIDPDFFTAQMSSNHHSILLDLIAKYADNDKVDTSAAEALVARYPDATAAEAEEAIAALQAYSSGSADVVYGGDTAMTLKYNGALGTTSLTATVLTTDGVVTTVTREINVYEKAEGIEVDAASVSVAAGETQKLTASLVGGTENIASCTWATDDTAIATVENDGTITGVAAGNTTVTVSVKTVEGNAYVLENIPVTVTAPANP